MSHVHGHVHSIYSNLVYLSRCEVSAVAGSARPPPARRGARARARFFARRDMPEISEPISFFLPKKTAQRAESSDLSSLTSLLYRYISEGVRVALTVYRVYRRKSPVAA